MTMGARVRLHQRAPRASLAKAKELGWTVVSMKNDWKTVFTDGGVAMSDLTAIDVLIDPDEATMERARAVNARMLQSLPEGWAPAESAPATTSPCLHLTVGGCQIR